MPPAPSKRVSASVALPPKPSLPVLRTVPIWFPPQATNCGNWDIQESHDLKNWVTIRSNAYTVNQVVWGTNGTFWRWRGRN